MAHSSHGERPTPAVGAEHPPAPSLTCPICRRDVPLAGFLTPLALSAEVALLAAANTPGWRPELGLCAACDDRFAAARDYLHAHFPRLDRHPILPTPVRLGASERFRGRGVTLAFLDAGFYAHPDLVEPDDRIL